MTATTTSDTIPDLRSGAAMARLRAGNRHGAYQSLLDELDAEYAVHRAALRPGIDWFWAARDRKLAAMIAALRDVTAADEPPEDEAGRLRREIARLEAEATRHEMRFILMDQRIVELEDLVAA